MSEKRILMLLPEFPSQTHTFFWREISVLRNLGVDVVLVSTRKNSKTPAQHAWCAQAEQLTTYLYPLKLASVSGILKTAVKTFPLGWWRCAKAIVQADVPSVIDKVKLCALMMFAFQLCWIAEKKKFSHIHVHSGASGLTVAMLANRLTGLSYSLTAHGHLDQYGSNHAQKWRSASFCICVSETLLDAVRQQIGESVPDKVCIAPMGVDTQYFKRQGPYMPWRKDGPLKLFICARLTAAKGFEELFVAIRQLVSDGYHIHLRVGGDDPHPDKAYRRRLESMIESFGLASHIKLLGSISEDQVRTELENAHIFVLPSWTEGVAVSNMEAGAMAVPVVASDVGGVSEVVIDRKTGLLIQPKSSSQIVDAVKKIADDQELALQFSQNLRAHIESRFNSSRSALALMDCLGFSK